MRPHARTRIVLLLQAQKHSKDHDCSLWLPIFSPIHRGTNSSVQTGHFSNPLPTGQASCNASTVSTKQERLKGSSEEGVEKGIRCRLTAFQQPQPPRCRKGNTDNTYPEPWRSKQGVFRGLLTTKLHTSCNKAVKSSVDASLETLAHKDQSGFHNTCSILYWACDWTSNNHIKSQ